MKEFVVILLFVIGLIAVILIYADVFQNYDPQWGIWPLDCKDLGGFYSKGVCYVPKGE